jgi:hypothetical protein
MDRKTYMKYSKYYFNYAHRELVMKEISTYLLMILHFSMNYLENMLYRQTVMVLFHQQSILNLIN